MNQKNLNLVIEWFSLQKRFVKPNGVLICPSIYSQLSQPEKVVLKGEVKRLGYEVVRFDKERLVVQLPG